MMVTNCIGNLILVFIVDSTMPICSVGYCVCVETWLRCNGKKGRAGGQLDTRIIVVIKWPFPITGD